MNNARRRPFLGSIPARLDGLIKIKGKGRWQGPGVFSS